MFGPVPRTDLYYSAMPIPSSKMGYVIGTGGRNLKRIEELTGARLVVSNAIGDMNAMVFVGTPEGVSLAKAEVEQARHVSSRGAGMGKAGAAGGPWVRLVSVPAREAQVVTWNGTGEWLVSQFYSLPLSFAGAFSSHCDVVSRYDFYWSSIC